jgi:hypothetical protein
MERKSTFLQDIVRLPTSNDNNKTIANCPLIQIGSRLFFKNDILLLISAWTILTEFSLENFQIAYVKNLSQ